MALAEQSIFLKWLWWSNVFVLNGPGRSVKNSSIGAMYFFKNGSGRIMYFFKMALANQCDFLYLCQSNV